MSSFHKLSKDTVRLLSTCQVVTSVHAVVKELVENSLDAKSTNIEVKLENYGLDLIEVRDNGIGIKREEVAFIALPHCTSKLQEFCDLNTLETYGFRGEALNSIASLSTLSVTTRTAEDDVACTYTIDSTGEVLSSKPSHQGTGTTVYVANIFKNLPVRKQCYRSAKRCRDELRKIEDHLLGFGLAQAGVRLVLKHNRSVVWQKSIAPSFQSNLIGVLGASLSQQMEPINYQRFDPMFKIQGFVAKPDKPELLGLVSRANSDRMFLFINQRPVTIKPILQVLRQAFIEAFPSQSGRYPVAVVCINVLPGAVDVNLEPNKTTVLLHDIDFITSTLQSLLGQLYAPCKVTSEPEEPRPKPQQKQKQSTNGLGTLSKKSASRRETQPNDDLDVLSSCFFNDEVLDGGSRDSSPNSCHNRCCAESDSVAMPPVVEGVTIATTSESQCLESQQSGLESARPPTAQPVDGIEVVDSQSKQDDPVSSNVPQKEDIKIADTVTTHISEPELLDIADLEDFEIYDEDLVEDESGHANVTPEEFERNVGATSTQLSLSQWSRGEALRDSSTNQPLEPVELCAPSSSREKSQKPPLSKLAYKEPSVGTIFDMINSRPVKRKADLSPSQLEAELASKRQRQLPGMWDSESPRQQKDPTEDQEQHEESPNVNRDKEEPSPTILPFNLSAISQRSDSSAIQKSNCIGSRLNLIGCCGSADHKLWLVVKNNSISCFDVSRYKSGCLQQHQLPQEGCSRSEVEEFLLKLEQTDNMSCDIAAAAGTDHSTYFHHIYSLSGD